MLTRMVRLEAKFLYVGDVLYGVGDGQVESRKLSNVVVRGDGFVDLTFENGDKTETQINSAFCIEAHEVPFDVRTEIRDDFRQSLRDSQRAFPTSGGQA